MALDGLADGMRTWRRDAIFREKVVVDQQESEKWCELEFSVEIRSLASVSRDNYQCIIRFPAPDCCFHGRAGEVEKDRRTLGSSFRMPALSMTSLRTVSHFEASIVRA